MYDIPESAKYTNHVDPFPEDPDSIRRRLIFGLYKGGVKQELIGKVFNLGRQRVSQILQDARDGE